MKKYSGVLLLLGLFLAGCAGPRVAKVAEAPTPEQIERERLQVKVALLAEELKERKTAAKLHEKAALELKMNQPQACLETLAQVRGVEPETAETHHLRASAYKILGKKDVAQREWEAALSFDPKHTKACYNLGVIHYELQHPDQAKEYWKKTVELDPAYSKAHYNLGVLEHGRGNIQEARAFYNETLKYDPNHVKAYINRGLTCVEIGNLNTAIECWGNAIRLDPANYFAHLNLGLAEAELGNFKKAVTEWEKALQQKPEDPWLYFNMAIAYDKMGNPKKAIELLKEALRINPNFEEAKTEYRSLIRMRKKVI